MKKIVIIVSILLLSGCTDVSIVSGESIESKELEDFFRKHKIDENYPVALKKHSLGGESYLVTIHGYPNNLSVCQQFIEPYNKGSETSMIAGTYFCSVLR
ncbi:hypothetical protein SPONN_2403 [uncultured Candidatus Thioglobus sp.]|nr:hypothetical protein SPONN_2403 [uncultured Candidatus Thioglobus sp.]